MATTSNKRPRVHGCQLRRPGDPRCSGRSEVLVSDIYGTSLWGCVRHAGQALRLVPRSRIVRTRRRAAAGEVADWLHGRTP